MSKRPDISYFLYISADTGVINPHHRIEEYIEPDIDVFLLYRFGLLDKSLMHGVLGPFDINSETYLVK